MIVGSGVDIEEVARIRGVIERHGRRFLERVFTPGEIAYAGGPGPFMFLPEELNTAIQKELANTGR